MTGRRALTRTGPCGHSDLGLPDSRTVWNEFLLFISQKTSNQRAKSFLWGPGRGARSLASVMRWVSCAHWSNAPWSHNVTSVVNLPNMQSLNLVIRKPNMRNTKKISSLYSSKNVKVMEDWGWLDRQIAQRDTGSLIRSQKRNFFVLLYFLASKDFSTGSMLISSFR